MRMNIGKRYMATLWVVIAVLTAISCGANSTRQTKQSNLPAIKHQTIKLSEESLTKGITDTLRFGVMRQGELVIKDLTLENVGTKPMVLLRHVTSCGCVNIEYERKPIAANQSCDIHFTYDSRGQMGWQMKLLEFYFADSATPLKIYIEAEVE